jgi:hypothetical protein
MNLRQEHDLCMLESPPAMRDYASQVLADIEVVLCLVKRYDNGRFGVGGFRRNDVHGPVHGLVFRKDRLTFEGGSAGAKCSRGLR